MLISLFIIGHMEIGGGYCRSDMMMYDNIVTMEYPCEYYSELKDLDKEIQKMIPEA